MGIGSWGEELQGFLGGLYGSDYVRDFQHAAKTFRPNFYQNAPKLKFLYHVVFEINDEAWPDSTGASNNLGILVRDIQLPSYKFDVKEYNQYNRKRLVQTKINYEPIEVTFHDDSATTVTNMWHAYYTYYYADSKNPQIQFNDSPGAGAIGPLPSFNLTSVQPTVGYDGRNIYDTGLDGQLNWGYIGEPNWSSAGCYNPTVANSLRKTPFFKNITIFGFSVHNFVAYTLVNPIIKNFSHDKYSYDDAATPMKNNMSIDYETVVYNVGYINGEAPSEIIKGFGDPANYDRTPSPITLPGSNGRATGQGGYLNAISTGLQQMSQGNFLAGLYNIYGGYRAQKGRSIREDMRQEFLQGLEDGFNPFPQQQRNQPFWTPGISQTPAFVNTAGSPPVGTDIQSSQIGPTYTLPYRGLPAGFNNTINDQIAVETPIPVPAVVTDFIPIAPVVNENQNFAETVAGVQINNTVPINSDFYDKLPYYERTGQII